MGDRRSARATPWLRMRVLRPSALEPGGGIRRPWFFFRRRRRRGSGAIVCDSVAPGKRRRERRTTTGDRLVAEAQPALKTDPFIVIPSTVQTAQQYPYKRRGRRRTTSAGGLLAARFLHHASVASLWFHPPATPHLVPAAAQSSPYDEFHYPGFQAYVKISDLEGDFYLTGGTITEPTENPGFFSTEFTYIDPSTQEVTGETCSLLQDYRPAIEANAEALDDEISARNGTPYSDFDEVTSKQYGNVQGSQFQYLQTRYVPQELRMNAFLYPDYVNNPFASRVFNSSFTEANRTVEFVPDDFLPDIALPHERPQVCHFALRLTRPIAQQQASIYRKRKVFVAYGFKTTFHFRVVHRNNEYCRVGGKPSQWCQTQGADGFAFVVQNNKRDARGLERAGMGYSGLFFTLAVEFDMFRDWDMDEDTDNHVAVMTSMRDGQPTTASHENSRIAETSLVPDLQDGTHKVEIVYDTQDSKADEYYEPTWFGDVNPDFLRQQALGRVGMLRVYVNDVKTLVTPLDLSQVVSSDNLGTFKFDINQDNNADDDGIFPGRGYVGFASSTGDEQRQAVDILDWHFESVPPCTSDEVFCRVSKRYPRVSEDACKYGADFSDPNRRGPRGTRTRLYCSIMLRNVARAAARVSAKFRTGQDWEGQKCIDVDPNTDNERVGTQGDTIQWNHVHQYFLGCNKTVHYNAHVTGLWLTSTDGTRSVLVEDPHILDNTEVAFRRQAMFEYCVREHEKDPFLYYQPADCNCAYCVRLFDIQSYYSVFYQSKCGARYGMFCRCLEMSDVGADLYTYSALKPMTYVRAPVCRGCTYHSQCNYVLKAGQCQQSSLNLRLGNPLAPDPIHRGFIDYRLDQGRVKDGRLRGDVCNCEPGYITFVQSGMCQAASGLTADKPSIFMRSFRGASQQEPISVDECYENCDRTSGCNYFTHWDMYEEPRGLCELFHSCPRTACNKDDTHCEEGKVYKMEAIGTYMRDAGGTKSIATPQLIYPLRQLQTNRLGCFDCLRQFPEKDCVFHCGPPQQVTFQHYPAGQACASCIFAGNYMHELNTNERSEIKSCVYTAIGNGEDPWVSCDPLVKEQAARSNSHQIPSALDLFNGVATHFMTECPGKTFNIYGGFCAPNIIAKQYFTSFVLHHQGSKNNTLWPVGQLDCVNAVCDLVPRDKCYSKLAQWDFAGTGSVLDQVGNLHLLDTGGVQVVQGQGLLFDKTLKNQYMVTPLIPKQDMQDVTLEVWATIPPEEGTQDALSGKSGNVSATTAWKDRYAPLKALDQDMNTYWSTGLFEVQRVIIEFEIDFGKTVWAEGWKIYFFHRVLDFATLTAEEGYYGEKLEWTQLNQVLDNNDYIVDYSTSAYFRGRWFKLRLERLMDVRETGPGAGKYVASIREIEVYFDRNLARLHPTNQTYTIDYSPQNMLDKDEQTYWSSPPYTGVKTAAVMLQFAAVTQNIAYTRISWNLKASEWFLYAFSKTCDQFRGPVPPVGASYAASDVTLITSETADITNYDPDIVYFQYDARCVIVYMVTTPKYDRELVQIRELDAAPFNPEQIRGNVTVAAEAGMTNLPAVTHAGATRALDFVFDGDLATYFFTNSLGYFTIDFIEPTEVFRVRVVWATVTDGGATTTYSPAGYSVTNSNDDGKTFQLLRLNPTVAAGLDDILIFPGGVTVTLFRFNILTFNPFLGGLVGISELEFFAALPYTVTNVYTKPTMEAPHVYDAAFYATVYEDVPYYDQGTRPFAWQDLDPVMPYDEQELYNAEKLADGLKNTAFLSTFNKGYPGGTETLRITMPFDAMERVDVVVVEWRYRSDSLILQCGADVLKTLIPGSIIANLYPWDGIDYATFCPSLTLTLAMPRDSYADYKLIGIREVRAYEFGTAYPLASVHQFLPSVAGVTASGDANLIQNTNDAAFYALQTVPGVWSTSAIVIPGEDASVAVQRKRVSVVLDLGADAAAESFWGCMLDFGTVFPSNLDVFASMNAVAYSVDPIFNFRGKIDNSPVYLFNEFRARYVKLSFLDPGTAEVTTVVGNTTQTAFQTLTTYQLRRVFFFNSRNKILGVKATSNDRYEHTSEIAVDGNLQRPWVNYLDSTRATLMVDLLDKREVVGDLFIRWWVPAKDFMVDYTNYIDPITNAAAWTHLETVTGNIHHLTTIVKDFDAQYIRLTMTRSAHFDLAQGTVNKGQIMFAIYAVDMMFEKNVAMGKMLQVAAPHDGQPAVNPTRFTTEKILDGDLKTFWFGNVAEPTSILEIVLDRYIWVGGIEMVWRYCPDVLYFMAYNSETEVWSNVTNAYFNFTDPATRPPRQTLSTFDLSINSGFQADKIRLMIAEKRREPQGSYWAALKEIVIYKPATLEANTLTNHPKFKRPPKTDVAAAQGTDANSLVDGSVIGAVWTTDVETATIELQWQDVIVNVGRIYIYWVNIADEFQIDTQKGDGPWINVFYTKGNTLLLTQVVLYRQVSSLRIRVLKTFTKIALFEIRVWEAVRGNNEIKSLTDLGQPFDGDVLRAIDPDINTFWMPPPAANDLEAILDLNRVYTVTELKMYWTYYPTRQISYSTDNDKWFLFLFRPDAELFGLQEAEVGVKYNTKTIQMRYLKILISVNYEDPVDGQLGTGLRDIRIIMDGNLGRNIPAVASSVWDYPLTNVVDGDLSTYWAGELQRNDAYLYLDLQYTRNVAGLEMTFGDNYPTAIAVHYHDAENGGRYAYATETTSQASTVFRAPDTLHFQTRYVRVRVRNPKIYSPDPDFPNDDGRSMQLLQIYDIKVFEHRGGGGLFGLENVKTLEYSTVAFAQFQPLQWNVASDGQARSDATFVTSEKQRVGEMVHVVTTFDRDGTVNMFRNGEAYGNIYNRPPVVTWAQAFDDTRLVFGVRSTQFAGDRGHVSGEFEESNLGRSADLDPRSAFFHGTIHRASIIKGRLLEDEVRGLYNGVELGCHCYDACPVGSNRFFPHVPVPCSGQGACRRSPTGRPFAPGTCDCLPGYSGTACQYHCSEISETGCCDVDDDCPCDKTNAADCAKCNLQTKACEFPVR